MKRVYVNEKWCLGCHLCEYNCAFANSGEAACVKSWSNRAIVNGKRSEGKLKRMFIKNGYLTGFILIGCTERAGIYTSLIREKTPLGSVDFETLKKIATSAAFSSENRRKMFGGVV